MADQLKNTRKAKKSVLTREINTTLKFMDAGIYEEVEKRIEKIQLKFAAFEEAHEAYHLSLEDDDSIGESDVYFDNVQDNYISTLQRIRSRNSVDEKKTSQKSSAIENEDQKKVETDDSADTDSRAQLAGAANSDIAGELINLINLPRMEIQPFDGDPLKFHSFFATFDEAVDRATQDPRVKLTRLLQYTTGKANAAISSCALLDGKSGYEQARKTLKTRFGNDHLISDKIIQRLKNGQSVRSADDLLLLSDDLTNSTAILQKLGKLKEVDTQSSIVNVVDRLQPFLRHRWRKHAMDVKREKDAYPSFQDLVEFVRKAAEDASDPVYGQRSGTSEKAQQDSKVKKSFSSFITTANGSSYQGSYKLSCVLCGENHRLIYCNAFKSMKPPDRLKLVRERKLCENCLLGNHVVANCRKPSVCSVPGCGARHTKFLHINFGESSSSVTENSRTLEASSRQVRITEGDKRSKSQIVVPIVPVIAEDGPEVSALLDTGSNSSFCSRILAEQLGLRGIPVKYSLNTMSRSQEEKSSTLVNFKVKSKDSTSSIMLTNVYVVDSIPVQSSGIDATRYQHLSDLPVTEFPEVHILIGLDNSEALVPLEVRKGQRGNPFAVRTLLGWSVNGPAMTGAPISQRVISNFVSSSSLEDMVDNLWSVENEGYRDRDAQLSQADREVLQLWEERTTTVNGRYEIPIPWKRDAIISSNAKVAEGRLKSLRTTLDKQGLFDRYNAEINTLVEKGYAECVKLYDVNSAGVWYLPHHCVVNDKKPGKLRVVFDCSSRFQGESLNDKCHQGPETNNKLVHVLLRFREHEVAFTADIEAMYYQVLVPVKDRDALRFLWFDNEDRIVHYQMTRHVFGGVWSGSAATFALRQTVTDFGGDDRSVDDIVLRSFYVDDCLRSFGDVREAVKTIEGVKVLLHKGGFRLTKFVSNNTQVIQSVPEDDRAKECKDLTHDLHSRVLGIRWNFMNDEFQFNVCVESDGPVTRRSMLSVISSVYDPLGLVSPTLVLGKVLFQEATRMKLEWDQEVPPKLREAWTSWLGSLKSLGELHVPRCVKPRIFDEAYLELHHFSDASQMAYGSCSYLRCINKEGRIHTALIFSKARVAPIKSISIPRLELQAALLSARIDHMLRQEMSLDLATSHFWVDSEIALKYIKNDDRRFHVYVSNRVGEIRSLTRPTQWHFVAGNKNMADIISRGRTIEQVDKEKWFQGPDFLRTFKSQWSEERLDATLADSDPEVKGQPFKHDDGAAIVCTADIIVHPLEKLIKHYSSWTRLKRAVAWILRVKKMLMSQNHPKKTDYLSSTEVLAAENEILKHVQGKWYGDELRRLNSGCPVHKSSSIVDLQPIVNDGLLAVGGRLKAANLDRCRKHPIIIPHKDEIAAKIVSDFHNDGHPGTEWTLSLLRAKYWITSARSVIKRVRHGCVICRRLNAPLCTQQMADLPLERLQPEQPPFTFVGLDYFGPFMVKHGRGEAKRYGCVFTCLTTRAIHIEMIKSLETDSFLNGLRRFMARRGHPRKLWSDNGTNFVGACAELRKGVQELRQSDVQLYCSRKEVEWIFNPPHASHMGGIWERLIRTIRKTMAALLMTFRQRLTDEVLETLLCEVEAIVNSRPITKVTLDTADPTPLTPNHLLLLKEGPDSPPGSFSKGDMYRRRWKYVQHLANQFWRRWVRNYLPELQKRQKWLNSSKNLKKDDLVLICDENTPRGLWPLGIITEVKESRDGLVRSVKIKTKSSILTRPVTKVVSLEGD